MAKKTRMKGGGWFDGLFGSKSAAADKAVADANAAKAVADKAVADANTAKAVADKAVADDTNSPIQLTPPLSEGGKHRKTQKCSGGKRRRSKSKSRKRR
jgi:hypothetical protein